MEPDEDRNRPSSHGLRSSQPRKSYLYNTASKYHKRLPGLRKLPLSVVIIITLLIAINVIVWIAVGVVLAYHPQLAGTAALAYSFGLRHALDADHISAIDLMTRRLIASGQEPVTVGTFFSLGHSTIVVITSLVVAGTSAAVSERFTDFSHNGGIIGSSVSASFLIILSCLNVYILLKLIKEIRRQLGTPRISTSKTLPIGGGFLFGLFRKLFKLIDAPWKMYPLGVLFGLGFDTSSEIALLGIASLQGASGTSLWLILIYPILFTAGMCLLDTADGALMMSLYTSTALARDNLAILYYSIVLTVLTIIIAAIIGIFQLLSLIENVTDVKGHFWQGVRSISNHYDSIGGAICGSFVMFGLVSILIYPHWRHYIDRTHPKHITDIDDSSDTVEIDVVCPYISNDCKEPHQKVTISTPLDMNEVVQRHASDQLV